ncbi:MAG: YoaK family protein [Candidatus Weimeria sp.]
MKKLFHKNVQTSESIEIGIMLAISGGFMDAYSYMERGEVFANAQTGNIVLFSINLSKGNWHTAAHYFFPFFAFALGIAVAEIIRMLFIESVKVIHWRQISVVFEAVALVIVSTIPTRYNLIANAITSFACGIQVQSFRKVYGNGMATTMCIGNLRGAVQNLCDYFDFHEGHYLQSSVLYFSIIGFFAVGAVIGNIMVGISGIRSILFCTIMLLLAFSIMFANREE